MDCNDVVGVAMQARSVRPRQLSHPRMIVLTTQCGVSALAYECYYSISLPDVNGDEAMGILPTTSPAVCRYGYNLDMGLIAALTGACSVCGLPWLVAATVRSMAHVKSLTNYEQMGGGQERIEGIVEQRCVVASPRA